MRKQFPGFYIPTDEEFNVMWRDGIFSFDANVLLNLYRYTKPTRDRLLEILGCLKDQLWLTNQAGLEFHRNRQTVIADQLHAYDTLAADLSTSIDVALSKVKQQYARNFNIDIPALEDAFNEASDKVATLLKDAKAKHPDFIFSDPILEQVTTLFDGRVGEPYSKADLVLKHQEAQARYDRQQPPGFKDAKKSIPERYGDALVWFQLIVYAQQQQKPVIFITDDGKIDWWNIQSGKTTGLHPDLAYEWQSLVETPIYLYSPQRFMEYAEKFLELPKRPEVIDEVREVSSQIMIIHGRHESQGGGWPGIGMYRMLTNRNVAAALRLGVSDPAVIDAFNDTEAWSWVRQQGLTSQIAIDHLLGEYSSPEGIGGRTPWELREGIEGQSPERRQWAEDKAKNDYLSIAGIPSGITNMWSLERRLGRSVDGLTLQEIAAELAKMPPDVS